MASSSSNALGYAIAAERPFEGLKSSSQGFVIVALNLGGGDIEFCTSSKRKHKYFLRLKNELEQMFLNGVHVLFVSEINKLWCRKMDDLRIFSCVHDEDESAICWDSRDCWPTSKVGFVKIYLTSQENTKSWRRSIQATFSCGPHHPLHFVVGSHTIAGTMTGKQTCRRAIIPTKN